MGVKNLWTILAPIAEKKPLWELKDQTVAIDLSGWICENQTVDSFNANLYLRYRNFNLSFRNIEIELLIYDETLTGIYSFEPRTCYWLESDRYLF